MTLIKQARSNVYNQLVLLLLSDITQLKGNNGYTLNKLIHCLLPRKVKRKCDYLAWRNPSISILQINGQP